MRVYCGRSFSDADILTIRGLIQSNPKLKRIPLSRQICELLQWRQPNGALKAMTTRVALLRMQADGLIQLPPSQNPKNWRRPPISLTTASDPQPLVCRPVHELPPLRAQVLTTERARLWNEYVARYHYLGYTPLSGSQLRYEISSADQLVALISFGAWKLAARERFIGWNDEQRRRNLPLVINNARFLVLPWIQSKGLASKILALMAGSYRRTGNSATASAQSCSRLLWRARGTAALVTRPPIGSASARPPDAARSVLPPGPSCR